MQASRVALWAVLVGFAAAAGPSGAADPPPRPGSPEAGRALFIGSRAFQNGGAPCGACHGLGGEGIAFTASLGPELSRSLSGVEPADLEALLEALPFPTMAPIYEGRALTPAERADLAAFLVPAARQGPPGDAWHFEACGALVAALLFLGLALASRRRKPPSRARLLARAHPSHGGSR
jgi:mono/diheme cytochrome c family protein